MIGVRTGGFADGAELARHGGLDGLLDVAAGLQLERAALVLAHGLVALGVPGVHRLGLLPHQILRRRHCAKIRRTQSTPRVSHISVDATFASLAMVLAFPRQGCACRPSAEDEGLQGGPTPPWSLQHL